jgi:hypothetical protein
VTPIVLKSGISQVLIMNNITSTEMVHVSQCKDAKAMWDNLEAVRDHHG